MTSDDMTNPPIRYALIGCGGFGRFCLDQYKQMSNLKIVGVFDLDQTLCTKTAIEHQITAYTDIDQLLKSDEIDLVHIATPPFAHTNIAIQALNNGKHVLCEKPLTLTLDEAQCMIELARSQKRVLAANLIMRYDPLSQKVKQLIDSNILGQPLHGFFENYAADEPLPPTHWFWKPELSGGIFIEHGVHFFDLYRYWLGDFKISSAQHTARPNQLTDDGRPIMDQVNCTAIVRDYIPVNFYHGFTQPHRLDRQEMRIVFERGSIRLFEWVPTSYELDCILSKHDFEQVQTILQPQSFEITENYSQTDREFHSYNRDYLIDGRYRITGDVQMPKTDLYGHMVRALLDDQITFIHNPNHQRLLTEDNGFTSLQAAVHATELASQLGSPFK
ncbi:Glucose--fructose oxidoreductase precursor [Poriferisphaera corsica]|uniref:Glucose--fructose oxidoreductase n=1 Tax=Poriferisphaera corsica TaxID=2528020 RepID=A0A517YW40_9BACT|nr:Gfo/Idh/MocA family oxidoreductase [Poriferisphaera corsica]QDU34448.1 Glucose--fructose oxidoreductase precursor [Poriferisphaera corsica]